MLIELQKADVTLYQNFDRRHVVYWEPRKGLLLTNRDNQYDNKEERRVIKGSETKTARKLHQGIRTDHKGDTYPVKDPRYIK